MIADWCAKIYKHGNFLQNQNGYSGWEKVIQETSMLDLTGIENNAVSSVRVHPGCTLKLFNEHNNVALLDSLTDDVGFLDAYNDQASSLSCTCQGMMFRTLHFLCLFFCFFLEKGLGTCTRARELLPLVTSLEEVLILLMCLALPSKLASLLIPCISLHLSYEISLHGILPMPIQLSMAGQPSHSNLRSSSTLLIRYDSKYCSLFE